MTRRTPLSNEHACQRACEILGWKERKWTAAEIADYSDGWISKCAVTGWARTGQLVVTFGDADLVGACTRLGYTVAQLPARCQLANEVTFARALRRRSAASALELLDLNYRALR